ncbi:MAG: hypothetical protein K1X75_02615 [Leptospirales bacterium]|nr:hypothetical protein [Leptospirales bacterium]
MLLDDAIRLFLDSIGRNEEYEFYLRKFRSDRSACFALLAPDLETCREDAQNLAFAIEFLLRLDLTPALLLSGPRCEEMRAALLDASLPTIKLKPSKRAQRLDAGFRLRLGAVIDRARQKKRALLIVWPQEHLSAALQRLSGELTPRIHLVRMRGALKDEDGRKALYVRPDSVSDLDRLDQPLAELALRLLQAAPTLHLSVTAPFNLLKEIFTVKGAGTLVRTGSRILEFTPTGDLDQPRLRALLEQSFGRNLVRDDFLAAAHCIFLEENYQGAAVVELSPWGPYLSKFAVGVQARGLGVAQELWESLIARFPKLFWRSRSANSINRWYARVAEGAYRAGRWTIFWRGLSLDDLPQIIRYCLERDEDFRPAAPAETEQ